MRIFFLLFSFAFLSCGAESVQTQPSPLAETRENLVDKINRYSVSAYKHELEVIDSLNRYSDNSDIFRELRGDLEEKQDGRKIQFLSDKQAPREGLFHGQDQSRRVSFSKVWSERYHEEDTFILMEIADLDSDVAIDIILPKDDFENFRTHFAYSDFKKALDLSKPIAAKVFVPAFQVGTNTKVEMESRGREGRSIECGPFPEISLDRSFIFMVRDRSTNVIRYIGEVA